MTTILIIEDDSYINNLLNELLTMNQYQVFQAYSGTEALLYFEKEIIDLVLLDLMIPGKTGKEVLSTIRNQYDIPIIVLTAITEIDSKVDLLKAGASDYVTKPFNNEELLARIEVQLRNANTESNFKNSLTYKGIVLNHETYMVTVDNQAISLARKEFDILRLLMKHPNKVFSKTNIYESIWDEQFIGDENTVTVHVSNLRTKLSEINASEEYIQTVWGVGYKMS